MQAQADLHMASQPKQTHALSMLDQRWSFYVESSERWLKVRPFYPRRGKMMDLVSVDLTAENTKEKLK